jgi:predicted TIM-barrel fold metal-dependent hydrolase
MRTYYRSFVSTLCTALCFIGPISPTFASPDDVATIIDVHVHTQPKHYALLLDVLASTGVTRFVNLSGGQPDHGLDEALEKARPHEGRIIVCANVAWRDVSKADFGRGQARMLARAKALGAGCLKIPKALGLYVPDPRKPNALLAIDDPILDPIWRAAGIHKLPVFIHTADPKAFFEPMGPSNERMAELGVHPGWSFADAKFPRRQMLLDARNRVIARHPNTRFIGVHFANNPEDPASVSRLLDRLPNLYVDIAARLPELGRHPTAAVRRLFTRHQDRILFGTDLGFSQGGIMLGSVGNERPRLVDIFLFYAIHFRWFETRDRKMQHPTPIQGDWLIDAIGLPRTVLRKIYYKNALKLLWGESVSDERDVHAIEEASGMPYFFE